MADNYLQYAVEVTGLTDEEIAWFQQALTWDLSEEQEKAEAQGADPDTVTPPGWWEEDAECVGLSYELDQKRREVLLYAEENGNTGCAAELLFAFVTEFRPAAIYTIEWAATCSRMRPGAFGGGACVISREGIRWQRTGEWASRERKTVEARRAAEAKDEVYLLRVAAVARAYCDGDGRAYGDAQTLLEDVMADIGSLLASVSGERADKIVAAALDNHAFDLPEETEDGI